MSARHRSVSKRQRTIMQLRDAPENEYRQLTWKQIGEMLDPPVSKGTACKLYWNAKEELAWREQMRVTIKAYEGDSGKNTIYGKKHKILVEELSKAEAGDEGAAPIPPKETKPRKRMTEKRRDRFHRFLAERDKDWIPADKTAAPPTAASVGRPHFPPKLNNISGTPLSQASSNFSHRVLPAKVERNEKNSEPIPPPPPAQPLGASEEEERAKRIALGKTISPEMAKWLRESAKPYKYSG